MLHDSSPIGRTRIAVLNSHPIQYFAPLYAYLNAVPDLDVTAIYLSDFSIRGGKDVGFGQDVTWDVDLLAGYRSVFLGDAARTREPGGFWSLIAPQVWSELRSGRYDVVWLHGHNYAANLIAFMAAKTAGLPVMMRGETHLGLPREGIKSILRRPVMGLLYRCVRPAFGNWLSERSLLPGDGGIRRKDISRALFRGQRPLRASLRSLLMNRGRKFASGTTCRWTDQRCFTPPSLRGVNGRSICSKLHDG